MSRAIYMLAAMITIAAGAVCADPAQRQITVSGTGQVVAAPDMATITLGVTNEAAEAAQAMARTSSSVRHILDRLEALGLAERDVQTQRLSLNPVWSNRNDSAGQRARITGFVAANTVRVRVRALTDLGTILDAVIADGANDFNGLQFSVQDSSPLITAARRAAVGDAMARAALLADAAGVTLGPILSMSEQGGTPRPMALSQARAESVPIAAGEITVAASVLMVFAIAD